MHISSCDQKSDLMCKWIILSAPSVILHVVVGNCITDGAQSVFQFTYMMHEVLKL